MSQKISLLTVLGGSLLLTAFVQVGWAENRGAFSFFLENDVFALTDRYYTHGLKLTWISPDRLSSRFDSDAQRAFSLSFGQNIYTPADIEREDLIEDDRPYAGVSYFCLAFHRKIDQFMDTLEFMLGIVGPHSYAEQMQRFVHNLFKFTDPKGWEHQLKDELVFAAAFDRKWRILRLRERKKFGCDMIGHLGGSLGNLMTAVVAGCQFRIGWNLPLDFGTFLIRPGGESSTFFNGRPAHSVEHGRFGIHSYVYVAGHAVYRNIFLDGNTFQESHHVDKYPFVADIVIGIVMTFKRVKLSYAYVYRTKQFKTQSEPQIFGALNFSFAY
jgi:lipid A 3-O-deacylase